MAIADINLQNSQEEPLFLSDVSPQMDWKWDVHRVNSLELAEKYMGSDFAGYGLRTLHCSPLLDFRIEIDQLRLRAASFCRVRYCPICQWRRSLMWKAKAHQLLPGIIAQHPAHRWIFLTLTIRNCAIAELRDTVALMHRAFRLMTKRRQTWTVDGWVRGTEVTRSRLGEAHPHIHALLMVPSYYFSGQYYLSQSAWAELWRQSLGVDYTPVTDVRAIHQWGDPCKVIPEIFKYQTKARHLLADRDWLVELTRQMHGVRAVGVGGVLRNKLRELTLDPANFIHSDEESDALANCPSVHFAWSVSHKRYQAVEVD
ncbi:MAG: protein rep [Nostoc sp. C3-bin3]|nr:protein rep [Nostoc sp. C3-bin3]